MWPFHKHRFEFVQAIHNIVITRNIFTAEKIGGGPITSVTWKCACGKIKQKEFDGHLPEEIFADVS